MEVHNVSLSIPIAGTVTAGTKTYMLCQLPGTAIAGGITLTSAAYCSNVAIAVGTAPSWNIITKTTAGVNVATVGANGSAAMTAGTPIKGTISTYWIPGTLGYLALEVGSEAILIAQPAVLTANVQYVMGRGNS
jgi:hypothetical protein